MIEQELFTAKADASLLARLRDILSAMDAMTLEDRVATLNAVREEVSRHSPFKAEPVDTVRWISSSLVVANDYNPNTVAPPEMKLLERSIKQDGYTQPIVAWKRSEDGVYEVVDGFHRHRVGKESPDVRERIQGYLPVVAINEDRASEGNRMAATIRHNRARGKHKIDGMADIVVDLKKRNWSDEKIGRELGMDPDEVLRLAQITGLAEMFHDREFSEAWSADAIDEDDKLDVADEAAPKP